MAKKKPKKSKFRSEADRSSARGRKMRFSKQEVSPEELGGRRARNKRAAQRGAAATASGSVHSRVHKANEDENVGTEAMDYGTEAAEGAVRTADHAVYSAKMHGRKQPENPEVDASGTGSNPASKLKQKSDIKREYAAAKRGGDGAAAASGAGKATDSAKKSKEAADKGSELLDKLTKFIKEHYEGILIIAALGLLFMFMDIKTPVKLRCNVCGNEWQTSYNLATKHRPCPVCSPKVIAKAETKKQSSQRPVISEEERQMQKFIKYREKLGIKSGHTLEALEFIDSRSPAKAKCLSCGHVWSYRADHLLERPYCPRCKKNR